MENYEQKYREALEWIRSIYPTMQGAEKEDAEHYFPELKESEDEKHINLILRVLDIQQRWNGATGKKFNPYQGEIDWLKSIKDRVQPKEEWSQEDIKRIQRIHDFIWKNRKGDTDEIFQQEQDANWLMTFVPQPKQELTEEDKEVLNTIIFDVTRWQQVCGVGTDEYIIRAKAISFLKSIKDKPKQEWTEKDMVMLTSIISDSEQGALLDPEQINWLKTKIQ